MIQLNETEQKIADILVEAAINHRTVSFTEIKDRVGITRRYLGEYLSHIGQKCKELGLPIITVLVVYKGTEIVGKGYEEFDPDFPQNPQVAEEEKEKVWANNLWVGLV